MSSSRPSTPPELCRRVGTPYPLRMPSIDLPPPLAEQHRHQLQSSPDRMALPAPNVSPSSDSYEDCWPSWVRCIPTSPLAGRSTRMEPITTMLPSNLLQDGESEIQECLTWDESTQTFKPQGISQRGSII